MNKHIFLILVGVLFSISLFGQANNSGGIISSGTGGGGDTQYVKLVSDTTGAYIEGIYFYKDTLASPDSLYWHDGNAFKYINSGGGEPLDTINTVATKTDLVKNLKYFPTVADIRTDLILGERIKIEETGAEYFIQNTTVTGYNGGGADGIAVIDLGGSKYAVLQPDKQGFVNISDFGAVADDVTNSASAIIKANSYPMASGIVFDGTGTYFSSGTVTLTKEAKFGNALLRSTGNFYFAKILDQGKRQIFTSLSLVWFPYLADGFIRPEYFGGFADGVTDARGAINVCINRLYYGGGGTVLFGDGEYLIQNGIVMNRDNVKLLGSQNTTINRSVGTSPMVEIVTGGVLKNLTIENISFRSTGGASSAIFLNSSIQNVKIKDCRFFEIGTGVDARGVNNLIVENCFFDRISNGIINRQNSTDVMLKNNTFHFCVNGILGSNSETGLNRINIKDSYFDMSFFYQKTDFGGNADFTTSTITDVATTFTGVNVNSFVRVYDTVYNQTCTVVGSTVSFENTNFIDSLSREFVIFEMGGVSGIVDQIINDSTVSIYKWLDDDRNISFAPVSGTGLISTLTLGKVSSGSGNSLTVTKWYNWEGENVTPSNGSRYEYATRTTNYPIHFEATTQNVTVDNNFIYGGYSDNISLFGKKAIITNNTIVDAQDMGITLHGIDNIVTNNRIEHYGAGGIFSVAEQSIISNNNIKDGPYENNVNTVYLAAIIEGGSQNLISNNYIQSNTSLNRYGISTVTGSDSSRVENNFILNHSVGGLRNNGGVNVLYCNNNTDISINGGDYQNCEAKGMDIIVLDRSYADDTAALLDLSSGQVYYNTTSSSFVVLP